MFNCPISAIRRAAAEAGYPCSASGIRNLLGKTRADSRAAPRGVIDARVKRMIGGVKKWHPRGAYSASLLKYEKQFLTMCNARPDVAVASLAVDDKKKVPTYICASGSKAPQGYGITAGRASFEKLDHDFVCGEKMLLVTSGLSDREK